MMAKQKDQNTALCSKGNSFGTRTSFVIAMYPKERLIPQDLRALSLGLFP